jgi:hypothetical protein
VGQHLFPHPLLLPQLLLYQEGDAHHPFVLLIEVMLAVYGVRSGSWTEEQLMLVLRGAQELANETGVLRGGVMGLAQLFASVRHIINIIIRSCTYGPKPPQHSLLVWLELVHQPPFIAVELKMYCLEELLSLYFLASNGLSKLKFGPI